MVPHGLFGMLVFVVAEIMFFAGLISAFVVIKAGSVVWPPPNQPRLPVEETALNTLALLASGFFLILAHRAFHRGDRESTRRPLWLALALGAFFVLFQGAEWVAMLGQGLTLTSSSLGSFFYMIVGVHALHAVAALVLLAVAAIERSAAGGRNRYWQQLPGGGGRVLAGAFESRADADAQLAGLAVGDPARVVAR